ncbi:MAG: hydroxyacid dehydrogenase [Proteobacteria bacterium]|nr:hydroxyacid dehydrogenase [Pseudomonadota bacterium]
MSYCLIVQPIHEIGFKMLKEYGIEPRMASAPDMDTVAREIGGAVACISRNAGLNRKAMQAAKKMLVFGNHGIGVDPVDVAYANEIGLPIVFTPYTNIQSVAEQAIGLMFAVHRQLARFDREVKGGNFKSRFQLTQHELWKKTLGIIGFGRIGRRTAQMCQAAFEMTVIAYSPPEDEAELAGLGVRKCATLAELMREADVIALHTQLTPETRGLVSRDMIALMKPDAILVNNARGPCVDEAALIEALKEKRIAGAGLDVYVSESMPPDHPLLHLDNVVLAPHAAGSTVECLERTAAQLADQIKDVVEGRRPPHLINPQVWERRRIPA